MWTIHRGLISVNISVLPLAAATSRAVQCCWEQVHRADSSSRKQKSALIIGKPNSTLTVFYKKFLYGRLRSEVAHRAQWTCSTAAATHSYLWLGYCRDFFQHSNRIRVSCWMKVKIFIAKSSENPMQKYSSFLNCSVYLNKESMDQCFPTILRYLPFQSNT